MAALSRARGLARLCGFALRRRLYRDPDPDIARSVIVAGTARSGTTWLAELLDAQVPLRLMFEPFHAAKVAAFSGHRTFEYRRPEEDDERLEAYARRVLRGAIRDPWIDRRLTRLTAQRRLIKDIRANLFLRWLHGRFPEVPILFLLRHPCAVVASRLRLGWATDADIAPLLEQPRLREDFLDEHDATLRAASTAEEKHAVIWCVTNLVPLRQFAAGTLPVLYYEELCRSPQAVLEGAMRVVGHPFSPAALERAQRPSATTRGDSAVMTGDSRVEGWRRHLAPQQVERVLGVVRAFGLDHIYGDGGMPRETAPRGPERAW